MQEISMWKNPFHIKKKISKFLKPFCNPKSMGRLLYGNLWHAWILFKVYLRINSSCHDKQLATGKLLLAILQEKEKSTQNEIRLHSL